MGADETSHAGSNPACQHIRKEIVMGCDSEECTFPKRENDNPDGMTIPDMRVHRGDCKGFDTGINCIGCFKAEILSVLNACHDHMLMDPTGRGPASRVYKKVCDMIKQLED